MPKRTNKKRGVGKFNPTGIQSSKEATDALKIDELPGKMPAIVANAVEKLSSTTSEERECGCNMIAGLGTEPGAIELLMKSRVVKILGPLVKDSSTDVRLAALGALRNISVDGRLEVCERMVDMDVMTPLVLLLKEECGPEWVLADKTSHTNDVLIQAVNLLWNLCESSETAVKIFNQDNLVSLLLPKLDPRKFTFAISIPTAYCLQTASEENKNLVGNNEMQSTVTSLLIDQSCAVEGEELQHVLLKVLLIGILHNLTAGTFQTHAGPMIAPSVQHLAHTLAQPLAPLAEALVTKHSVATSGGVNGTSGAGDAAGAGDSNGGESADASGDVKSDIEETVAENEGMEEQEEGGQEEKNESVEMGDGVKRGAKIDEKETAKHKAVELAKNRLLNIVTSKQLALELLSNLCCADDESDDWEEMNESESESDVMDDSTADDAGVEMTNPIGVSSDIHSLLTSHHVVRDVMESCLVSEMPSVTSLCQSEDEELKTVAKQLHILQSRSLTCLNNLAATMSTESLGGQQRVLELWKALSLLVKSQQVKSDEDLLESVTCCIRAMAQKLAEINSLVFQEVSESDLHFLYQLAHQSASTNVRIHTVRTVATIGCMLARINPPHAMMKPIGVFLLVVCMKDADLIVSAETLDALFDVFSEDHLDAVCRDIGLVQKLTQFMPVFKNKIHQQKSKYRDHIVVISSAKTNLARFIKYKNG